MAEYILGIDIGTTSLKTAVFDHSGAKKASALVEYLLETPKKNIVEVSCDVYMDSIIKCLSIIEKEGMVNLSDITCVGFSVQGETLCFLDENGIPLKKAIVWMDNRAAAQADKMRAKFSDEKCYEITGQVSFESCWPAPKILWVKENEPELFKHVRYIMLLEDYVIYQLTGKMVTEGSLLTSTLYWNIQTKKYWKDMLDYIGIDESYLPEIKESGELVGTILPEIAEKLGISQNAKICTGCLDQAAGAIGVGNIKPGIFSENIGAALAVCVPTAKLTYDPNRKMPVHYFAMPDTYMMHTFTTGGMCLKWFRDVFCKSELEIQRETGLDCYYLMDKEADSVPPGADGLITLPHLQGAMAPDTNLSAKGVFYGMTLKHTKGHFIRSIMESLGYILCRNIEAIDSMGLEIRQIRTLGGGSKSDIWNQIKADITGKQLCITESSQDIACLGAAVLAGVASGIFESIESACEVMVKIKKTYNPNQENHLLYRKQYQKFKMLFSALEDIYASDSLE
ncbi:MAG: FGGY family carbohydrate kinase [Oscillospiraceae bacterium]